MINYLGDNVIDKFLNYDNDTQQTLQEKVIAFYELIQAKTINNMELKRKNDQIEIKTAVLQQTIQTINKKVEASKNTTDMSFSKQMALSQKVIRAPNRNIQQKCQQNKQKVINNQQKFKDWRSSIQNIQLGHQTKKAIDYRPIDTNRVGIKKNKSKKSFFHVQSACTSPFNKSIIQ